MVLNSPASNNTSHDDLHVITSGAGSVIRLPVSTPFEQRELIRIWKIKNSPQSYSAKLEALSHSFTMVLFQNSPAPLRFVIQDVENPYRLRELPLHVLEECRLQGSFDCIEFFDEASGHWLLHTLDTVVTVDNFGRVLYRCRGVSDNVPGLREEIEMLKMDAASVNGKASQQKRPHSPGHENFGTDKRIRAHNPLPVSQNNTIVATNPQKNLKFPFMHTYDITVGFFTMSKSTATSMMDKFMEAFPGSTSTEKEVSSHYQTFEFARKKRLPVFANALVAGRSDAGLWMPVYQDLCKEMKTKAARNTRQIIDLTKE